jgi:two-component system, OmpR family, alkaline phosphatase synthesis response regulator PhoP
MPGMPRQRIVIIEDDADIRELLRHNLVRDGYEVVAAGEGERGLQLMEDKPCDLLILDLMLPGIQGLEVCRRVRENPKLAGTGILMVTAKDEEADVVAGLELGADDYVLKPFSVRVLLARVRAVLRRVTSEQPAAEKPFALGHLTLDAARHEVSVAGSNVDLTLAEFNILRALAEAPGRVLTRNQLLDRALGQDRFVLDRTIDVHVSSLRRKLGPAGDMVETVRGVGYRLKDQPV